MRPSFRGAVDAATQLAEIQVALRDQRPHVQLAGQREGWTRGLLVRGHLGEKPERQGLGASLLRRKGTVDDLKLVTDPGRALITGKWKDVGRFKGPILRALAGRAPYFHNGSAASLLHVVNFYDARFALRLTPQQKLDLVCVPANALARRAHRMLPVWPSE